MKTRSTTLTKEEREVLILAAQYPRGEHLTNSEIGQHLGISVSKVKTLIHQACVKLGARNRGQAILIALRRGELGVAELISLEELADILSLLGRDRLRQIARLMREGLEQGHLPGKDEQLMRVEKRPDSLLTNRERDVLVLACQGFTNSEIADKLCMTRSAVHIFLNRASTKLGVHKRTDLAIWALRRGEVSVGDIVSVDELLQNLAPLGAEYIEKIAQRLDDQLGKEPS